MLAFAPRPILALAALMAVAAPARADRIDAQLHDRAPAILAALKKENVKTVGVLRFRVERGARPAGFDIGPINDGLAARIENLLVIHADRTDPLRVLRDPNREAAAHKLGAWFTAPIERKKLFGIAYPLAWGSERAKPDAFLTGVVRCTGDMLKTTVVIELFTAANPEKLIPIAEFAVDTDRLVLADLGHRFNVARRGAGLPRGEMDRFAIGEARPRDEAAGGNNPPEPPPEPVVGLTDIGGIAFQLLVGDAPLMIAPANAAGARWQVGSPPTDKPIVFALKNTAAQRLGVVLKLNEISTIFEQVEDSALCRKYVLQPGQEIKVRGFLQEGGKYAPFKVLVGDEAKQFIEQSQLGDRAGKIRIEVFAESAGDDEVLAISLPRRLPATGEAAVRRDLESLQKSMMKTARVVRTTKTEVVNGRAVSREIIVPDKAALLPGPTIKEVDFKSAPAPIAAELIQIVKP